MSVEVLPVEGLPEVRPGDDLAALLLDSLPSLRDGDVVCVTQKVVSKAEGRLVPEDDGHDEWVAKETRRVVARRGDVVIAETAHGFVCANAGVDASNVEPGLLALLPVDPDGSAERIRARLMQDRGVDVGVVITDTFGRPWRNGVVNVAIGCAGLPALIDLRGRKDHVGRLLESTVIAFADEVAAASGLVMGKDAMVPAAIVRGLAPDAPHGRAAELIRPAEEDLFRESPLQSLHAQRPVREFGHGPVPRQAIQEAARAALAAADPTPWLFVALESSAAKRRLTDAPDAPVLVVLAGRTQAAGERTAFLLSAGTALENFVLALHAQGFASSWTVPDADEVRAALELGGDWEPLAVVACGPPPPGEPSALPEPDATGALRFE